MCALEIYMFGRGLFPDLCAHHAILIAFLHVCRLAQQAFLLFATPPWRAFRSFRWNKKISTREKCLVFCLQFPIQDLACMGSTLRSQGQWIQMRRKTVHWLWHVFVRTLVGRHSSCVHNFRSRRLYLSHSYAVVYGTPISSAYASLFPLLSWVHIQIRKVRFCS